MNKRNNNNKFWAVKKAIDAWNPYSLLPDAPDDEYDNESIMIAKRVANFEDEMDITKIVSDVFSHQFHKEGFTIDDCRNVAKAIKDNYLL